MIVEWLNLVISHSGAQDPLSIRYEVTIVDDQSIEHKSAERYYWLVELNESMQMVTWIFRYKMAEYFGDADAMEKIKSAPNTAKAEEAMKDIKGFDEKSWNEVRNSVALRKFSQGEEEWGTSQTDIIQ